MKGSPKYILEDKVYLVDGKQPHECRTCKLNVNCDPHLTEAEENIHPRAA